MTTKDWENVFWMVNYNAHDDYEAYDVIMEICDHLVKVYAGLVLNKQLVKTKIFPLEVDKYRQDPTVLFAWGLLVKNYGDYGVCPSLGWIDDENITVVLCTLWAACEDMYPERF